MNKILAIGITYQDSFTVQAQHTVPCVEPNWPGFQDMPSVLATAFMIAFMEQTCIQGLRPFLSNEEHTVGIDVNVNHTAASIIGSQITASIELLNIDRKILTFQVTCQDQTGQIIGTGIHKRAIINIQKFLQKIMPNDL